MGCADALLRCAEYSEFFRKAARPDESGVFFCAPIARRREKRVEETAAMWHLWDMKIFQTLGFVGIASLLGACGLIKESALDTSGPDLPAFGQELSFFSKYNADIVLLGEGNSLVAVSPKYQGRVMTSTFGGAAGASLGWINHRLLRILPRRRNVFVGKLARARKLFLRTVEAHRAFEDAGAFRKIRRFRKRERQAVQGKSRARNHGAQPPAGFRNSRY